ncbi:MAG: hypothetical protein RIC16_10445 [Rhodospirillales bacterium]
MTLQRHHLPALIGLALLVAAASYIVDQSHPVLWDLEIYQNAIAIDKAGGNPYEDFEAVRFAYAPMVLELMSFMGFSTLQYALLAGLALATFAHRLMRLLLVGALASVSIYAIFPVSFLQAFQTGNVAAPFHLLLVFTFFLTRDRWRIAFYATVLLFSLFKPYFLAYALLPALTDRLNPRALIPTAVVAGLCGLAFVAQYLVAPQQFELFLLSLDTQGIHLEDASRSDPDAAPPMVGRSLYYYVAAVADLPSWLKLLVNWTVTGSIAFWAFKAGHRAARRIPDRDERYAFVAFLAIVAVNLINPRLMVYDWFIMDAAAIAAAIVLVRSGLDVIHERLWPVVMAATAILLVVTTRTESVALREVHIAICVYGPVLVLYAQLAVLDRETGRQESAVG